MNYFKKEHFPIVLPYAVEATKFKMEQLNFAQFDLSGILGIKSRTSKILNKIRKLSLDMIR